MSEIGSFWPKDYKCFIELSRGKMELKAKGH